MQLERARIMIAGATGALGSAVSRELHQNGSRCFLAGRDGDRLRVLAQECGNPSTTTFEALDEDSCRRAITAAVHELGGLDAVIITLGVAAFGEVDKTDTVVVEELLAINAQAPMALTRTALPHLQKSHGLLAVVSAILAEHPTSGMAAYSASKAAISAWLTALRREQRRHGVTVFDIQPPHMDTGLAERAISGPPPPMPEATSVSTVVDHIIQGLRTDARRLHYDLTSRELILT